MAHDVAAMHVRRGDYLRHPEFYPEWFETYTLKIAPYLIENYSLRELHLFTDDERWCRTAFKRLAPRIKMMESDKRFEGLGDLVAMSRYPVLSIANSTFSWWAGAIAVRKGAQVIAPTRWSEWCTDPTVAMYESTWTTFDCQ